MFVKNSLVSIETALTDLEVLMFDHESRLVEDFHHQGDVIAVRGVGLRGVAVADAHRQKLVAVDHLQDAAVVHDDTIARQTRGHAQHRHLHES